jgi:hypothetical protein
MERYEMERKNFIKKKKKEKSLIDLIYFWGRIRSNEYQSGSRAVKTNKRKNFLLPSWIQMRIPIPNTDPDQLSNWDPDPKPWL